jgi:hypothetical protein
MSIRKIALCLILSLLLLKTSIAGHTLTGQEQKVLQSWLAQHAQYRVATDEDCECDDGINRMKVGLGEDFKPVPDYHPYSAAGDFNGDGVEDFAVAVIDRSKQENKFVLLIFNGPFKTQTAPPAFIKSDLDLKYEGLFYGPPRPKPYRLLLAQFNSDTGVLLIPRGRSYRFGE